MDKKPNTRKAAADHVFKAVAACTSADFVVADPRNPYAFVLKVDGQDFRVVVKPLAAKDSAD